MVTTERKYVWKYDEWNGCLLAKVEVQESPLEPGVWIYPSFSTQVEPPRCKKNEVPVYKDGSWSKVVCFVGRVFWDKKTREVHPISELGVSPDKAWTDKEPGVFDVWDETADGWIYSKDEKNKMIDKGILNCRMKIFEYKKDIDKAIEYGMPDVVEGLKVKIADLEKQITEAQKQKE